MIKGKVDIVLAICVVLLVMAGQIMVFSASSMYAQAVYHSLGHFFYRQLIWGFLSILLMVGVSNFNYRRLKNENVPMILIIGTITLLIGVLIFGSKIKGATRWFNLGLFNFQPSEAARLAIVIFLAFKLSKKSSELQDFKKAVLPLFLNIGIIVILILLEPNLSTALMIAIISAIMLFSSQIKQRYLAFASFSLLPGGIFFLMRKSYQLKRIEDWIKSMGDPVYAAHQIKQSAIGIGRGGFFGAGMGESKQKLFFLPDSHTDFIFSIIGEEWGFIGTTLILTVFVIILIRGLRIAKNAPDGFGQFLALGITLNVALYAFTNAAVVTNLFPATGLPMLFISYGGTHLLFLGISMGLLLNISRSLNSGIDPSHWNDFQTQRTRLHNISLEID